MIIWEREKYLLDVYLSHYFFVWIWVSTSRSKEISISTRKYFPSPCDAEYEESEIEERIKP